MNEEFIIWKTLKIQNNHLDPLNMIKRRMIKRK